MNALPPLPKYEIPSEIIEKIKDIDVDKLKKSEAYQKYCAQTKKRYAELKKQNRINWWKNNWIGIVTLIATVLTLIATVLFGLFQILK